MCRALYGVKQIILLTSLELVGDVSYKFFIFLWEWLSIEKMILVEARILERNGQRFPIKRDFIFCLSLVVWEETFIWKEEGNNLSKKILPIKGNDFFKLGDDSWRILSYSWMGKRKNEPIEEEVWEMVGSGKKKVIL